MAITNDMILISLGITMLAIIFYTYFKDGEHTRQIDALGGAIEEINRQIYILEKHINEKLREHKTELQQFEQYRESDFPEQLAEHLKVTNGSVEQFRLELNSIISEYRSRVGSIEESVKALTIPEKVVTADTQKIMALKQQGVLNDRIAKELRISKAQVDSVVKFQELSRNNKEGRRVE